MTLASLSERLQRHSSLVRKFSSAIVNQGLLSASNFFVGLALIRGAPDEQYGYYLLVFNSILLLTSLQGSFLHPTMAMRLATASAAERATFIGGMFRAQNIVVLRVAAFIALVLLGTWIAGLIRPQLFVLLMVGTLACLTALYREFFRTVFFLNRLPHDLLKSDVLFAMAQLAGVWVATRTANPAAVNLLFFSVASVFGGLRLSRHLVKSGGMNRYAYAEVWREIANHGGWSAAGSASHWFFSQGYNYVVAGVLDVASVSALGATRLLLMPINLMSSGVGPLMMPFAAEWLHAHGPRTMLKRVLVISLALTLMAGAYLLVLWIFRGWIFDHVLRKHFPEAETLLALWSATFLVNVARDQLRTFPATFGKFKLLFIATLGGAILSLLLCYLGVRHYGVAGAPLAVLVGEVLNAGFIVLLSIRIIRS